MKASNCLVSAGDYETWNQTQHKSDHFCNKLTFCGLFLDLYIKWVNFLIYMYLAVYIHTQRYTNMHMIVASQETHKQEYFGLWIAKSGEKIKKMQGNLNFKQQIPKEHWYCFTL